MGDHCTQYNSKDVLKIMHPHLPSHSSQTGCQEAWQTIICQDIYNIERESKELANNPLAEVSLSNSNLYFGT